MTVKEGWLGIVKWKDVQFYHTDVSDAQRFLQYVDGASYTHIHGAVTFDMGDVGQMCVRAKNTQGDYWQDAGSNSACLRSHKKFVTNLV